MDDFSTMFLGLSVGPGVAAIVGAGTAVGLVYFSRWIVEKVAGFFEDAIDDDDGGWACDFCGEAQEDGAYCSDSFGDGNRMCALCARDDSRWA